MISKSEEETAEIAKIFLGEILTPVVEQSSLRGRENKKEKATVVCLSGDLGVGKTTFIQAAGKHFGIRQKITSPTFVIMKKYPTGKAYGVKHKFLFHFDAYRLKNEKELLHLDWDGIINNKEHIVFIEWPENVSKIIPPGARFVYISHEKNSHRNLELK